VRRLEADLRAAKAEIESASQEHATDRGLLQEELRRVTMQASKLKDQVVSLKSEHERSLSSLRCSLDDLSMQNIKLEEEARSSHFNSQDALNREKQSVSRLSIEVEQLKLQLSQRDEERVKLHAAADTAHARNVALESCASDLRAELAALKLSGQEMQTLASDDHHITSARLEADIKQLRAQLRSCADEHARQMREISMTLDDERRRANAEIARCAMLEGDVRHWQLRLDSMAVEHAQELASVQEKSRLLQAQMQLHCDKLQQNLSAASVMNEREANDHVRLEQEASASQAVVDILRKHLHDAQESVSEHVRRCSSLEAELSAMSIAMERNSLENERCKQAVVALEARVQDKDLEIQRYHEKVSSEQRDADVRVKGMQLQCEASEERAALLQQQLHEAQQGLVNEKVRRSADELEIRNFNTELKLLTSTLAITEQQLRSKDSQILQMQEHATQLQQHLDEANAQKNLMQQRLEALKHDIDSNNFRSETERVQMQSAHSIATSGLLSEVASFHTCSFKL
jgi:chromosome segregation ATPase